MKISLVASPHDLFVNKLPNREKEFFCFIHFPSIGVDQARGFSWQIASSKRGTVNGERPITDKEREQHRVSISAILPSEFEGGELTVNLASCQETWQIQSFDQKGKFRLPLDEGQVLVVVGHRIGESHRSAQIASEHFAWDLVPLHNDGLRLLKGFLSETLGAQDFAGFGQPVLAPADGVIVKAVDGMPDLTRANEVPTNLDYYREDLHRAAGNYVIIDHGNGVWSLLAHFKNGSVEIIEGQKVRTLDKLGELGNSGFSSGPHIHFQFMNGPDFLTASPLPIELDLEGGTYAPQAGEITSSQSL
jgi:murein DD-endopeptidase MepM/ murein hydrolase activator NlpD